MFVVFWLGDLLLYPLVIKSFKKLGLGEGNNELAIDSFNEARRRDWKTRFFDTFAPTVTYFALCFTPWEANKLPRLFKRWDNNVSLNGDSGGVLYDGKWIGYHDVADQIPGGWEAVKNFLQVSYDDPRYEGETYYSWFWVPKKWRHPRNFIQRWCWIGFRNRATGYALDLGEHAWKKDVKVLSGSFDINEAPYFLLSNGPLYMYKVFTNVGPLRIIRSIGFKLDIVAKSELDSEIAAVVNIPFSVKGS